VNGLGPAGVILALLLGCSGATSASISCQPYGWSPAPVPVAFAVGPVDSNQAEQRAVALFNACSVRSSGEPVATIRSVTSTVEPRLGSLGGPNAGQDVWVVQIDATVTEATGGSYQTHVYIEVNTTTGVPTVVGIG
jgi:hypothetical protein